MVPFFRLFIINKSFVDCLKRKTEKEEDRFLVKRKIVLEKNCEDHCGGDAFSCPFQLRRALFVCCNNAENGIMLPYNIFSNTP